MGVLLGFAVIATIAGQRGEVGTVQVPAAAPVQVVQLDFADQPDGSVLVTDAATGQAIRVLEPGQENFIRGVMRGFVRERMLNRVTDRSPFTLTRFDDGRLALSDPETRREVELVAFGPTNLRAFASLMPVPGGSQ